MSAACTLRRLGAAWLAAAALSGCQGMTVRTDASEPVRLITPGAELPESALLDVGIEVFAPGPLDDVDEEEQGFAEAIRNAEARFIPVHLKHTMQRSGYWGAVRVVPEGGAGVDVVVSGEIRHSDGEVLSVHVNATDASGRQWLDQTYEAEIATAFYRDNERRVNDAFQALYNRVANDLATHRARMQPAQVRDLRRITHARVAAEFAPDAFGAHLARDDEGRYRLLRLPARDDPMLERVNALRERDHLLTDTVSAYYDQFYDEMWQPYQSWRKSRSEEAAALRKAESEATTQKLLGAAAILGAIVMAATSDSDSGWNNGALRSTMVYGGTMALKSGIDKSGETVIYRDAIRELGESFEAEVKPMVVDVDGRTVELTGSAETQYATWRRLLRDIHASETGLVDVSAPGAVEPPLQNRF